MNEPIVVVATISAVEGQAAAVERALRQAVVQVRPEPGCERYDLHREDSQADRLVMIERWASRAALDRHLKAPAFQELARALDGIATIEIKELAPLL